MKWVRTSVRFVAVTVGIIICTSLGIDATQYFEGSDSALSALTQKAMTGTCPAGTGLVTSGDTAWCVDLFEAGVSESCPIAEPRSAIDTAQNVADASCVPQSTAGKKPWLFVTYHQAAALCAKAGKQLLSNRLWYQAALGTPDSDSACAIASSLQLTGTLPNCQSGTGMYDMIGNAWEWVDGEVIDQMYAERILPEDGYVTSADASGLALTVAASPDELHAKDYFWSKADGTVMMMRGGFYNSGSDAGVFSVHADMDPAFSGDAVGFRCASIL